MLYKYRPWNRFTSDVLSRGEIFVPTRKRLNDLAELIHPIRFEDTTASQAMEQARAVIVDSTRAIFDSINESLERYRSAIKYGAIKPESHHDLSRYLEIDDVFWASVEAFYDRAPVHQALAYYALCLHEDHVLMYDDPAKIVVRLNEKLDGLGILSLSSRCDCPVMWAHYAKNHEGVIIAFDEKNDDLLRESRPVLYVDERPKNDVVNIVENIYKKAKSWNYEQEYRIITSKGDSSHKLNNGSIVGVIMGINMKEFNRKNLLSIARRSGIQVYQSYVDGDGFSILYRPA